MTNAHPQIVLSMFLLCAASVAPVAHGENLRLAVPDITVLDQEPQTFSIPADEILINVKPEHIARFQSLQVRVFRGDKRTITGRWGYRTIDDCLVYDSVLLKYRRDGGGVYLTGRFTEPWLKRGNDEYKDQPYLVVFEDGTVPTGPIAIKRIDVGAYFSHAYEIIFTTSSPRKIAPSQEVNTRPLTERAISCVRLATEQRDAYSLIAIIEPCIDPIDELG